MLVGNFGNATLTPINAATLKPGAAGPPAVRPHGDRGRGGGPAATAYVCGGAGLVPVTLTALGPNVGTQIGLPDAAQGVALSADGATAWVTQQAGGLVPVTLATGKVGSGHRTSAGTRRPSSSGRAERRVDRPLTTLYTARARKRTGRSVSSSM